MLRLVSIAILACAIGFGVVAGPALSSRPYHPKPIDFSMAAPSTGATTASASASGRVTSKPIRTPKRFNLVGLTWGRGASKEPRLAVRTRTQGGRWTHWSTVYTHAEDGPDPGRGEPQPRGTSNPDWVGEADWVQYRTVGRLPKLRLHFMNVRGTATRGDRARTALRRVANSATVGLAALVSPVARAAGSQPPIVSRDQWGASACKPRTSPQYGEVKAAFIHHTVNANDYSRSEAPDVVLAICRFHRDTNGWNDIGYNFLVDRFGTIYEGRAGGIDKPVIGAQAQGYNAQSTGIANIGTFTSVQQTPEAMNAMARLIRWKLPLEGVPTTGTTTLVSAGGSENRYPSGTRLTRDRIIGHRDTGATTCPGNALYAQLPELRRLVGSEVPGGASSKVGFTVRARGSIVTYGSSAPVTGTLTVGGVARGGLPVDIQAFVGTKWRTVATTTTAASGVFGKQVKVSRTRSLRARFEGQPDIRAANSKVAALAVRPRITLSTRPRAVRAGSRVRVRGRVKPRRTLAYLVLQQRRGKGWKVVGSRAFKTSKTGLFSSSVVPARSATYRYYVTTKRDRVYGRGVTKAYQLRVGRAARDGAAGAN